jgi:predicted PurR-regulated permease PerM
MLEAGHVNGERPMPDAQHRRAEPRKSLLDSLPRASLLFENIVIGVVVVAALYFGSELFVPLAVAVLLAFALSPLVRFLRRRIMPKSAAVALVVLLAFAAIFAVGTVITAEVTQLAGELPRYQTALKEKIRALNRMTGRGDGAIEQASETLRELQSELEKTTDEGTENAARPPGPLPGQGKESEPIPVEVRPPQPTAIEQLESIISVALAPLATAGIIIVLVVFLLLYQEDVRDRAIRLLGSRDLERTTLALNDAAQRLSRYFLTLVVMNAGFGAVIGLGLWAIGIPGAFLWGIIAMLLRFVPMVGVFIAAVIPLILAAAVDPGWSLLLWAIALYLVAEGIMNMVVEPLLQSSSTGLSALAILLSAAFWTLLWGPIGLVLAVPLTAVLVVLGRHVEGLQFIDVLLGDRPPLSPPEKFYQRMLAGDPHEAAEQAEEILKETALADYYDDVAIEGLRLAQNDADLGKLDPSRLPEIRDTAEEMIDELSDMPLAALTAAKDGEATKAGDAEALPAAWRDEDAVICIAGQSALDEVAASILVQLLRKHGFAPRLMKVADVSAANLQGAMIEEAKLVCVSMLDAENRGAYVRFLIRRIGRILPGVPILGGFWRLDRDDPEHRRLLDQLPIAASVKTLGEAIDYCRQQARADPSAVAPAATPEPVEAGAKSL